MVRALASWTFNKFRMVVFVITLYNKHKYESYNWGTPFINLKSRLKISYRRTITKRKEKDNNKFKQIKPAGTQKFRKLLQLSKILFIKTSSRSTNLTMARQMLFVCVCFFCNYDFPYQNHLRKSHLVLFFLFLAFVAFSVISLISCECKLTLFSSVLAFPDIFLLMCVWATFVFFCPLLSLGFISFPLLFYLLLTKTFVINCTTGKHIWGKKRRKKKIQSFFSSYNII